MIDENPAFCTDTSTPHSTYNYHDNNSTDSLTQNLLTTDEGILTNLQKNSFIGDPYPLPKPNNIFRLHAGNINGLKIHRNENDYAAHLREMKLLEADIIAIFELNLDTQQHQIKNTLFETTRSCYEYSSCHLP